MCCSVRTPLLPKVTYLLTTPLPSFVGAISSGLFFIIVSILPVSYVYCKKKKKGKKKLMASILISITLAVGPVVGGTPSPQDRGIVTSGFLEFNFPRFPQVSLH